MTTGADGKLAVRVWVTDVWDAVGLGVTPDWTVAELKAAALERATGRRLDPTRYAVKFRGAPLLDETQTLSAIGATDRAAFIVLPARRQPVR